MSQRLPYLPNLDHLKMQAKAVLRVCRVRNAGSQLADAQNAVARGYGFQNWPLLKAHVESVRRSRGANTDSPARPTFLPPPHWRTTWDADLPSTT